MDTKEKQGAVLGCKEEPNTQVENPVSGNVYLVVGADCGAIDGISYSGVAEPMEFDAFMGMENLPELFKTVTIRFVFADGAEKRIELPSGSSLAGEQIPAVPEKDGLMGTWEGLADADLFNILFDMTFEVQYRAYHATIRSGETRADGRPVFLAEGAFTDMAGVSAAGAEEYPELHMKGQVLEVWEITLTENGTTGRFLLPENADAASVSLLVLDENGSWNEVSFTQDGSYLVFALSQPHTMIALVQSSKMGVAVFAAMGCVLLAAAAILYFRKKKNTAVRS